MINKELAINKLSGRLVDIAFHVHQSLGPGLFESVYEDVLYIELSKQSDLSIERQKPIPLVWDGKMIARPAFKADLIINNLILIEIKSIDTFAPIHFKQVETYLRLTGLKVGLLINFNELLFKSGMRRIVNKL